MTKDLLLSIQGGGIRGIIPALALAKLEADTGKLTRDIFSWVGGTSTGALLAAAIAAGVPAKDSLAVYLEHGPRIFKPRYDFLRKIALLSEGHQFDAQTIYDVLKAAMGPEASTWSINQSPINILITAANQLGDCLYFSRDCPTNAQTYGQYSLLDAAVKYDVIDKKGAWYTWGEEKVGQGRDNAKLYLEQNPEAAVSIEKRVRDLIFSAQHPEPKSDDPKVDDAKVAAAGKAASTEKIAEVLAGSGVRGPGRPAKQAVIKPALPGATAPSAAGLSAAVEDDGLF